MYKNRLSVFLILFVGAFLVLTGRLACMQLLNQEYYEELAERKRRRVEIFAGPRGSIRDRHGSILAMDNQVYDASFIIPALDPIVIAKHTICQTLRISKKEFDKRISLASLEFSTDGENIQKLFQDISSKSYRRILYLTSKYPEKYGALIAHKEKINDETKYSLYADMEELLRKKKTLKLATELLKIPYDDAVIKVKRIEEKIFKITNQYQRSYELYLPYPLAKNISRDQVEKLEVQYKNYPGIIVTTRTQRIYPQGDLACHVLGYLRQLNKEEYENLKQQGLTIRRGFNELEDYEKTDLNPFFIDDMTGATGIEQVYDKDLRGSKGARLLERDTRSPENRAITETPPKPGKDIYLTLDASVQRAAQDALVESDIVGAAVLIDVKTGEIVALASSPAYDLGTFRQDQITYNSYLKEPYPLINRALSGLAPGSGFKLITAISALEEGSITTSTNHHCKGYLHRPGRFGCWKKNGHGSIDLLTAIEGSCNVYFYIIGEELGHEKLRKWSGIFGFGQKSGIDFPNESTGLIPSPDWKMSRVFPVRNRLRQLQSEFDNLNEEIKYIKELIEKETSNENKNDSSHLDLLEKRWDTLKKTIQQDKENLSLYESEKAWVKGDTRNMAIGQGNVLATPLQMARMVAAIANGGTLVTPHLTLSPGIDYLERKLPVSPDKIKIIQEAMHRVVFGIHGTARQEALRKHDCAAKTGTAEIGKVLNNGWIIGYAPFSNPRVAFAVVAERTKLHGGDIAGPVAGRILDAYFGKKPGDRKQGR